MIQQKQMCIQMCKVLTWLNSSHIFKAIMFNRAPRVRINHHADYVSIKTTIKLILSDRKIAAINTPSI